MLLIQNIGKLQTPLGSQSAKGEKQAYNKVYHNAAVLILDGKIAAVTENGALPLCPEGVQVLDAKGRLVTPGLIDAHTHLVFGGWRDHEIPLKIKGASYLEILKAGGGILDTVRRTREASEEELFFRSKGFLDEMLALGVTTSEIKSGYGLDRETELKQLRVIRRLAKEHQMDIVPTYLGAHAVPPEYAKDPNAYVDLICEEMLPLIAREQLAEYCDVFCEEAVFDALQSKRILQAAKDLGFGLKIHADEIEEIGGAELAGELGAITAEHLIATGEKGMAAMAKGGVTACLLPQTSLYLNKQYAQAREMIKRGIPVAIASDFNPGSCPSLNLQLSINLGYLKYRLLPEEILTAVTLNAACAIGKGDLLGTVEVGKQADLVIWNAVDFELLCYRMGSNLAEVVIKSGGIVK